MSRRDLNDPLPLSNQKPVNEDVDREIAQHIDLRTEELVEQGWTPEAARAEAIRAFGDVTGVARECREITVRTRRSRRREEWLGALRHDLHFALRILRRSPAFTIGAVLTLALGIGANTAIFSVVNGLLLRPLPYEQPGQLVDVLEAHANGGSSDVPWANFEDWRAQSRSFDGMAAYFSDVVTLAGSEIPARVHVAAVSQDFFRVMRVQPVLGRMTSVDDHRIGATPVALVSYRFWQDKMGGDRDLAGHRIRAAFDFQVIGVLPLGFAFPDGADLWYPLELYPENLSRTAHNNSVIGRLRDGLHPADADRELDVITAPMMTRYAPNFDAVGAKVTSLQSVLTGARGCRCCCYWAPRHCSCWRPAPTWRAACWCAVPVAHRSSRSALRSVRDAGDWCGRCWWRAC